jgi:hypothetical protein
LASPWSAIGHLLGFLLQREIDKVNKVVKNAGIEPQ